MHGAAGRVREWSGPASVGDSGLADLRYHGAGLGRRFVARDCSEMGGVFTEAELWMETFKQVMGFLLMLAVLFIASVIGRSGGSTLMVLLMVLFLSGLGAWIYGRWAAPVKSLRSRRIASVLALVLVLGGLVYGIGGVRGAYAAASRVVVEDGPWANWSPERVQRELAAGKPVFVDFTAAGV